jgi:Peptidase A4 family
MPVVVLRDENGDALRTFDRKYKTFNWSGYVLPKFQTNKHYVAASATWVVPAVTFKGHEAFSSNWVGIGGFCKVASCRTAGDETLIQLGTEQDAISDTETDYYAWWETLPAAEQPIGTLTVQPGDTITASLSCAGNCDTGQWTLSMTDETTTVSWTQDFSYASLNLSAEVIEEAPFDGGILPLADFHKSTFSALGATTANGSAVSFAGSDAIIMLDRQPHQEGATSNVSGLTSTHDSFDACFNSGKGLAHCPKP